MRYEIISSEMFDRWLEKLRDRQAVLAIVKRMTRAAAGNLGDVKPVGKGYRVYFSMKGAALILLLSGGDKSTQQKDIEKAKKLAKKL